MAKKNGKNRRKHNQKRQQKGSRQKRHYQKYRPVTKEELHEDLDAIIDKVKELQSLTGMVTVAITFLRLLGAKLVRMVLEQRDDQLHRGRRGTPCCPRCGTRLRKPERKAISRMTLLGRLRYWRRSWLCSGCHKSHRPLDATLELVQLHHGHSLEFVKALSLFCVLHAFEHGCTLFERCFGFPVSTHLAYPLVMGIGNQLHTQQMDKADELWKERQTNPEKFEPTPAVLRQKERAQRIYVMMDNSKVRIQEGKRGRGAKKRTKQKGVKERFNVHVTKPVPILEEDQEKAKRGEGDWRDVRALLIYREQDLAEVSKDRRKILHRRVLAHVGTKEEWMQLLHLAFHEEGVYVAHEVVVVADGGAGIWESIDELLPTTTSRQVVQILDWCHAVSHLWKVAKKWKKGKRKKEVQARARWVDGLVKYLAEGKVSNVLQRLYRLQKGIESKKGEKGELYEQLCKCIEYFEKHRGRMRYGLYRKKGMTIGSGAIESVHKWVIQARCKLAGMAWSESGLNAMLRLRCAWASGHWDDVFRPQAPNANEMSNDLDVAA